MEQYLKMMTNMPISQSFRPSAARRALLTAKHSLLLQMRCPSRSTHYGSSLSHPDLICQHLWRFPVHLYYSSREVARVPDYLDPLEGTETNKRTSPVRRVI